jgi:hypothetical protein
MIAKYHVYSIGKIRVRSPDIETKYIYIYIVIENVRTSLVLLLEMYVRIRTHP